MNFFIKKPNLTKNILVVGRGGGGGVARVIDFFFFKKSPSLKENCFLFEGVKVGKDWLV